MKSYICKAAILVAALAASGVAEAQDYRRSCEGSILVTNQQRNMVTVKVDGFTATGSGGGYMPNTIRLRAYRHAVACVTAAWAIRDGSGPPPECDEAHGITGFEIGSWPQAIARTACPAWSWSGSVLVDALAHIRGGNGCGGDYGKTSKWIVLGRDYRISCP